MADKKNNLTDAYTCTTAALNFAELLKVYAMDTKEIDPGMLLSAAEILKTMLTPVDEFLSWAETYVVFPEDDAEEQELEPEGEE